MKLLVEVVILLPILYAEHQEKKLINQLNEFFNFDYNIILLDSSTDRSHYFNTGHKVEFTPWSLHVYNNVDGNITGLQSLRKIESKNPLMIVNCPGYNIQSNIKLLNEVKSLQRRQKNLKIGIFFSQVASSEDLWTLFRWFWRYRIIYVFAATYMYQEVESVSNPERLLNIFAFNPFGTFNVTKFESFDNLFLSQRSNFQKFPLLLPYIYTPRSSDRNTWSSIIRLLNCSFNIYKPPKLQNFSVMFAHGVDVTTRRSLQYKVSDLTMYPILIEKTVILVPDALPYGEFSAYLMAITSKSVYGYFLIIILIVVSLLTFVRYIKQKKFLLFQSATDVIYLLMNDNSDIKYQKLSRFEIFLILPLTFVGFIFVNDVLSHFQSHLTKPVIQPQIDTAYDIYKSPLPLWISRVKFFKQTTDALKSLTTSSYNQCDWCRKITVVEEKLLFHEMRSYNRSMMFLTHESFGRTLLKTQKQLNIKGYHVAETLIQKSFESFAINPHFPFAKRVNEIMSWILTAGLYNLWLQNDVRGSERDILKTQHEIQKNREETFNDTFPIPVFICYLWLASVIVFIVEYIWGNRRSSLISNCLAQRFLTKLKTFYQCFAKKCRKISYAVVVLHRKLKKVRPVPDIRNNSTMVNPEC